MSNRTLYQFELSWHYSRSPWVGENIVLAVTDEGPALSCTIDNQFFDVPLKGKVDHFCELLEHSILRYLDGKKYKNRCVLDGTVWRLKIHAGDVYIASEGYNYYPWEFRESMNLFHDYFKLPWSRIHKEFKTMAHYDNEDKDCVRVEMDGEDYPLDHFLAPEEGPDGIDRWTSDGAGLIFGEKIPVKEENNMLTLEEAKAIALEDDPATDVYTEYEHAYEFFSTAYFYSLGPRPLIVMKDTGETFFWHEGAQDLGKKLGPMRLFSGEILEDDEDGYEDEE